MSSLAKQDKWLYMLKFDYLSVKTPPYDSSICNLSSTVDFEIWHNHLGRFYDPRLQIFCILLDPLVPQSSGKTYEACHLAKQKRFSFPVSIYTTYSSFNLIHVIYEDKCQ